MDSFISDLAKAIGRSMAAHLRRDPETAVLGRGERLAIATVLEIVAADLGSGGVEGDFASSDKDWRRMEAQSRRELDLVANSRSRAP